MKMAGGEANPHKNILRITAGVCHARLAIDWLLCSVKMTAQGETRALLILSVWVVSREITGVIGNVFLYIRVRVDDIDSYGIIEFPLEIIWLSWFMAWLTYLVTAIEILYVS